MGEFEHRETTIAIPTVLERALARMHEAVVVLEGVPRWDSLRVMYVNPAFTQITGYSNDEILGSLPEMLWGRQSDRGILEHAARELRAGRSFEGRVVSHRKDGTPFLLDGYMELLDDAGPVGPGEERFLMVICDVTERLPRDASTLHIVAALDHVGEAIAVFSSDRGVQYLNRAANEMFDCDDDARMLLPKNAWKQLEQGLSWSSPVEVATTMGTRRLAVNAQPVHGFDSEPSLLAIAQDVTDVERLQSIADSVNLSDNLGHFLSGIRHELGNPVNSIKTALTVLRSNLDRFAPEKVENYLDRVLGEVGRIEFLLRSLRSFSLHESVVLGRVAVCEIIREIVALVQPSVRRSGLMLVVEPAPSVEIIADSRALYQILLNLLSNSIEAQEGLDDAVIRLETSVSHDHVDIAVVDNGPGMTGEQMARAMRPFFTTKPAGTGLGLVIAERLASNQGGRLRLHTKPGEGTRAVVSLPIAPSLGTSP
jgi:PAS domain S-box-containing protein